MEKRISSSTIKAMDTVVDLPSVVPLVSSKVPNADIFLGACGFEARCAYSLQYDHELKEKIVDAVPLIGKYDADIENNERYRSVFQSAFSGQSVDLPCYGPQETYVKIIETLDSFDRKVSVIFDISGASSTFILSSMAALIASPVDIDLYVIYREAADYYPKKPSNEEEWNKLVREAVTIGDETTFGEYGTHTPNHNEIYSGHFNDTAGKLVIAVPSFRANRLRRCLGYLGEEILLSSDTSLCWIIGDPPRADRKWRTQFQKDIVKTLIANESGSPTTNNSDSENLYVTDTLDYKHIIQQLYSIVDSDKYENRNKYLLDFGPKLQAVGISLFAATRSEVGLIYSRPEKFNPSRYSEEVGAGSMIELTNLKDQIEILRRTGKIELKSH